MSECKLLECDRPAGEQDRNDYRSRSFCSVQHEVKYDDLKQDALDARVDRDREMEPDCRY